MSHVDRDAALRRLAASIDVDPAELAAEPSWEEVRREVAARTDEFLNRVVPQVVAEVNEEFRAAGLLPEGYEVVWGLEPVQ